MKGKQITVEALQEAINKRLCKFDGRKYEATEFHKWYMGEIGAELETRGIQELRPFTWGILARIEGPSPLLFDDRVAEVHIDFKRDKRYTRGPGRGLILGMKVEFHKRLAGLKLKDVRKLLLEEERAERIARCRKIRGKALQEAAEAEAMERTLAGIEI